MKAKIVLSMLLVLFCFSSFGSDTVIVKNNSGHWLLHIPDEGEPYLTVPPVLDNNPSDTPNPPPIPPAPPNDDSLRQQINKEARDIQDPKASLWYEEVYGKILDFVKTDKIPTDPDSMSEAFTKAIELGIKLYPNPENTEEKWRAFHKSVALKLAIMITSSKDRKPTKQDYIDFFTSVESGLKDSHQDNIVLEGFLQELLKILFQMLLEWLANKFN